MSLTIAERAAMTLQCAASLNVHGNVDNVALDLGYGLRVIECTTRAVAHVCTYGPAWHAKDPEDWWRETLADAEAALRCGEVS